MDSVPDPHKGGVAPFGYPRIKACSRLPVAFRSVPRPSSPPGAKASTECPSHAQDNPCTENHPQRQPYGFRQKRLRQRPSLIQHTTVSPLNTAPPRAGLTTHRSDVQRPSPETHQNLIHPDKDHIRPHGLTPHGRNRSRRPLPEAAGTRFPFFFHCMRQSPRALPAGKTLSSPRPLWPKTGPATGWWRRSGSNRRPPACKAGALPAELRPQLVPHRPNQIDRQMASQAK